MATMRKNSGGSDSVAVDDADLVVGDQVVGKNVYYDGARVAHRPGDDSLRPADRKQHVVPPNSLIWKYLGDPLLLLATGQRAAIIENLWPQLGQGVSDHSLIVSGHNGGFDKIIQRGRSTAKTIPMVVYSTPDEAVKYGVQVRNFHKSIKGDMPNGRTYHAINAETYYWAHVTFFEMLYRASDLGLLERPLTRAEREQIFEESKEWFSLYGVDDRAQPNTYEEFEAYLRDVFDNQLVNTKLAQYTVGFAYKTLPISAFPSKLRPFVRPFLPSLQVPLRWITVGVLEP
ncbi:oxygenase MpaB family protein, partial [Mycolicibacter minnesotensis]